LIPVFGVANREGSFKPFYLLSPNRQNAERSSGAVTAEGKARVSQNAIKLGLFSVANFVRPEEQDIFNEFESGYISELSPATPLEQTLAREIIQAAWRLRRCASLEISPPENLTDEEFDRLQTSIDRARAAAQRTFHRSLKELRRLQTERLFGTLAAPRDIFKLASADVPRNSAQDSAEQTQSEPAKPALIPRGAQCPCKSGQKYKRCCGRNAPPVLGKQAA
jgi:uncharacterized protein YecA (UPF0149 family)